MLSIMLSDIKRQVTQQLTQRCTIATEDKTTDEYGSPTLAVTVVATNVPCRLIRGDKPTIKDLALQEKSRDTYRLIVAVGTLLATGQRVTIDGAEYEILGLRQSMADDVFHEALIGRLA